MTPLISIHLIHCNAVYQPKLSSKEAEKTPVRVSCPGQLSKINRNVGVLNYRKSVSAPSMRQGGMRW